MKESLELHNIYTIPVGHYFNKKNESCYLVYSPLANVFFLATKNEVIQITSDLNEGNSTTITNALLNQTPVSKEEVSEETFCTLHLLLNEKCNFACSYCYSAAGRSTAELDLETITKTLEYFLSNVRHAVKNRTVMFMGGGEPMMSWKLLKQSAEIAESIAAQNEIDLHLSLTTNGSILSSEILDFLEEHHFTVQVSFEVLPDVQNAQRGMNERVSSNLNELLSRKIDCYVRSTITQLNVERIPEMVQYTHEHFPALKKLSCQQVVDASYMSDVSVAKSFFNRYYESFQKGIRIAKEYGIDLRSSSSHLVNYSKRVRFCFNVLCLTPYKTLMTCPDVSSPNEADYDSLVIGEVGSNGVSFNHERVDEFTQKTIFSYNKCQNCFARWNCGSGCPSNRRVYSEEVFDAQCDFYRRMLADSLMRELGRKFEQQMGESFINSIAQKLSENE